MMPLSKQKDGTGEMNEIQRQSSRNPILSILFMIAIAIAIWIAAFSAAAQGQQPSTNGANSSQVAK
jgi:hypothetical protein